MALLTQLPRALIVCVEYGDILAATLPYNRHHFSEVMVVTTPDDAETIILADHNQARVFCTDAFYRNGAMFNKWLALEEGLDAFGRHGLLCLMDADICWPKIVPHAFQSGYLYGPYRHVLDPPLIQHGRVVIPPESFWTHLPRFQDFQFPGFSQIFWADDPALPDGPWHETDWIHAGGADSAFQDLWPVSRKHRLRWPVLHLGQPFANWCGRTQPRSDGVAVATAASRAVQMQRILAERRLNAQAGRNPYEGERIKDQSAS